MGIKTGNKKKSGFRVQFFNTYEPVSSFYRDLLPYLAEKGMEIEVLVSSNKYFEGRDGFEESLNYPRIKIKYIHSPDIFRKTGIRKIVTLFSYAAGVIWRSLFGPAVSLNFFLSQPPMFSVWGYFLKILRRQPYYCLIMDLYPDVVIKNGLPLVFRPVGRILNWISRFALNHADGVIAIGRCMHDYLRRTGVERVEIKIITNWVNERTIFPVPRERNVLRRELGLKDAFIVLYSGNMGVSHLFNDILEVARRLQKKRGLTFVFIGDGARRKEILNAKDESSLDNIIILPYQPVDKLAMSIGLGDIHFISLRSGFEGLVVPSKAYSAMAAARPILYQGSRDGEIARMITEEGIGAVVEPGHADMLEKVILSYCQNPAMADEQGIRSYEVSQTRFNREKSLDQYYSMFCELRQ